MSNHAIFNESESESESSSTASGDSDLPLLTDSDDNADWEDAEDADMGKLFLSVLVWVLNRLQRPIHL
jgi:hypothetical protein